MHDVILEGKWLVCGANGDLDTHSGMKNRRLDAVEYPGSLRNAPSVR